MENYICINGKKTELTEAQLKDLGIELPKASPFERASRNNYYYAIDTVGVVRNCNEEGDGVDCAFYNVANYCTDKYIMQQRAWHETLSRLLWRYSMEHGGNEIHGINYVIYKDGENYRIQCTCNGYLQPGFVDLQTAEDAINRIIIPFMAKHPDFKW